MEAFPDFLRPLEYLTQPFPEEAVRAAIARRDESVPHFLAALEWTAANMEKAVERSDYILPEFAMYLLAQFRETRAYESVVQIARHSLADDLFGDTITQGLNCSLASISGGNPGPIQSLIEDEDADEYARGSGLQALGAMMKHGMLARETLSDYMTTLYCEKIEREESHVWNALVMVSTDLGFPEHLELIREAYQNGLADPYFESLESVEERLRTGELFDCELREYRLVDDVIEEMSWWACFDEKEMSRETLITADEIAEDIDRDEPVRMPLFRDQASPSGYRRAEPKIGRNDPCPCGSGRKYKKCCME